MSLNLSQTLTPSKLYKPMKVIKNSSQPNKVHNQEMVIHNEPQQEKMTKSSRQTKKGANRKNGITSSSQKKTLEQLFSKGPASFGSPKRLHTQSKMSMANLRSYLETKPFFTKYHSIRLKFPRLRAIVKDINEIWFLDLAHVDKPAKYNRDVKYLLLSVDWNHWKRNMQQRQPKHSKRWSSTNNH